ncbi:hypothetical protein DMA11_15425 [Marinilabiliaceae bacterium JC017]|nr:hypothetical protein DMA11_15425 [Marinilabiliaceae bacterium JC017]
MMKLVKNNKVLLALLLIIGLVVLWYTLPALCNGLIRTILESRLPYILIWILTFAIHLMFFIYSDKKDYNTNKKINPNFGSFFDVVIGNGIGISTALVSALKMLKAFYFHKVFEIKYFERFGDVDLWTITLTMAFLSYFLIVRIIGTLKELIWLSKMNPIEIKKSAPKSGLQ